MTNWGNIEIFWLQMGSKQGGITRLKLCHFIVNRLP